MIKHTKWLLWIAVFLLMLVAILWGGRSALYVLGEREIYLAAQENAYCHDKQCNEGKRQLVIMLERETGIPTELVSWCMAANAIYTTPFSLFDGLKQKFVDWMYQSCGRDDVTLEDAVLSIGEPE